MVCFYFTMSGIIVRKEDWKVGGDLVVGCWNYLEVWLFLVFVGLIRNLGFFGWFGFFGVG